jgi:hypothetical protein
LIEGIPLVDLTAPALLGVAILLLLLGRLVPKAALDDKQREADQWRTAYEAEREARATSDAQTVQLLEVSKTTHDLTVAMFDALRQTGGHRAVQKD